MNTLDWEREHERFMTLAYIRTKTAAERAFCGWHASKRDDAIAECMAKMWDQWSRLLNRGRNPEPMLPGLIRHALLWVRYDRRLSIIGRARTPDVFDFRTGFKRQMLSDRGVAAPTDRSDPENSWIDWNRHTGDNPADLAAALETSGVTLAQFCDL